MLHGVSDLYKIFQHSVKAVLPQNLIRKSLQYDTKSQILTLCGKAIDLNNKNVFVVGAGKAVSYMAKETETILGTKVKKGIISVPIGIGKDLSTNNVEYFEGAENNLPDKNSEDTARKIKELANTLGENDFLVVLISGGGSALLPLPYKLTTLEEKLDVIKKLGNSGADIKELNVVRKRLSSIKGGKLAIEAQPAQVMSLILSDIVGDPVDLIASGPTAKNCDNPTKALDIINKYNIYDNISDNIKTILQDDDRHTEEFPTNIDNFIIGSNKLMIEAAIEKAKELKYTPIALSNTVVGDVKLIAEQYVKLTILVCKLISKEITIDDAKQEIKAVKVPGLKTDWFSNVKYKDPLCLIFGGETTVEVKGNGKGGRNQQLALEFSKILHEKKNEIENFGISFLSAGTDGIDGPTNAAGAIGYKELITEATKDGLHVDKYLKENDSYNFYRQFRSGTYHLITGHTNTNVMDIHLIVIKALECHLTYNISHI